MSEATQQRPFSPTFVLRRLAAVRTANVSAALFCVVAFLDQRGQRRAVHLSASTLQPLFRRREINDAVAVVFSDLTDLFDHLNAPVEIRRQNVRVR